MHRLRYGGHEIACLRRLASGDDHRSAGLVVAPDPEGVRVPHYAHRYHAGPRAEVPAAAPLLFPGDREPDYVDFAYYSFVAGKDLSRCLSLRPEVCAAEQTTNGQ